MFRKRVTKDMNVIVLTLMAMITLQGHTSLITTVSVVDAATAPRNLTPRSHLSHPPILAPGLPPLIPRLLNPVSPKSEHTMSEKHSTHSQKSLILCKGSETRDCKPSSVEYFASSVHREGDKIIMLKFDFDQPFPETKKDTVLPSGGEIHRVKGHGDIKTGDGSSVHVDIDSAGDVRINEGAHPLPPHSHPSSDSHRSSSRKDRITVCAPENEHVSLSQLTNQINLMSHVFCRQMGYMTYVGRSAANVIDEKERTIWPSVICNGTEQRLEDCYWPDVTLTHCKQVLEVQCGSCSKYFSHVDDGVIMSPGFPNSFPFTVECDWLIYTHLGQGIELRFVTFNFPTSQLPMQQIGQSSCVAANAYLEIKPNGDDNPVDIQTLTNTNRYCVTRSPDRKMIIKSKAVWLHFSSGIHSNFFWNYRSRPFLKRPLGIKIYFKAIANEEESSEEVDAESSIVIYLICGISAVVFITLILIFAAYVCIKKRSRIRTGESKNSDGNMNHHFQVVESWRTATSDDGMRNSVTSRLDHGLFNGRNESVNQAPTRFVTCTTSSPARGGNIDHHLRNFANQPQGKQLVQQTGPPPFVRSTSGSALLMNYIPNALNPSNNYEEIPAARRPALPPRYVDGQLVCGQDTTGESPQSVWSTSGRKLFVSKRGSNGVQATSKMTRSGIRNYTSRKDHRSMSHSERLESLKEQSLTELEMAELETSCNNRVYMQIVCDSDGNCQYIPNNEIVPSMLPGQSSYSSPSLRLSPPSVCSVDKNDEQQQQQTRQEMKQGSPHSLPPSFHTSSPPTQLITNLKLDMKRDDEQDGGGKETEEVKQKEDDVDEEKEEELQRKKLLGKEGKKKVESRSKLKSESGSRIGSDEGIVMRMNKTSSFASVI